MNFMTFYFIFGKLGYEFSLFNKRVLDFFLGYNMLIGLFLVFPFSVFPYASLLQMH